MAKIGPPKGSGKRLKVREKSMKSQGISKWILSVNPVMKYHTLFWGKIGKTSQNLSSVAVVIGSLRVNMSLLNVYIYSIHF